MPHPVEFRERVVQRYLKGDLSAAAVAELFDIGSSSVYRWTSRFRETGSVEPKPTGGREPKLPDEVLEAVAGDLPDSTLVEMAEEIEKRTGIQVHERTVSRRLRALRYTRKKRHFEPTSGRPSG